MEEPTAPGTSQNSDNSPDPRPATEMTDRPCTISEFAHYLAPLLWPPDQTSPPVPTWPPDLFAIVGSILEESGAYTRVVADWPPPLEFDKSDFDPKAVEDLGMQRPESWGDWIKLLGWSWRRGWPQAAPPRAIAAWWDQVVSFSATPITEVREHATLCHALLQLFAATDEACFGLGTGFLSEEMTEGDDRLWEKAEEALTSRLVDASLCLQIDPSRVRVLPKARTSSCGMTIRSLSLYLSLCRGGEVKIGWHNVCGWKPEVENYLNLVLIPWPEEILPSHFRELRLPDEASYQPEYRMFSFGVPPGPPLKAPRVEEILAAAETIVHKIDGLVLPESSVDAAQLEDIWKTAASKNCLMIAGVRSIEQSGFCGNRVETRFPIVSDGREGGQDTSVRIAYSQEKHHRWKLDRPQLISYGLASQLHLDHDWWEGIEIGRRNLLFFAIQPWLTTCVLICEDLARQDPMAEVIRSVGPSLVISLLMDGPQLKTRWPSRYATVLADDPGTSVLTLSSIGMVKLSRPLDLGVKPSRVIALWKDATSATAVEIDLPEGASAVVLSLVNTSKGEQSADGRFDEEEATTLVLGGVHPVFLGEVSK